MEEEVQYGDHDVQVVALAGDTGSNTNEDVFLTFEPLGKFNGLDPDEVAELVYYERSLNYGAGAFEFGLGFNLSEDEFAEQAANNNPTGNDVRSEFDSLQATANYTEAGLIDFFSDDQSINNGSSDNPERVEYYFPDMFGSGPYIDQTDDISIHYEPSNNTGSTASVGVQIRMVWKVTKVEEGIPEFALPRR